MEVIEESRSSDLLSGTQLTEFIIKLASSLFLATISFKGGLYSMASSKSA